jgi:hypothetical protein
MKNENRMAQETGYIYYFVALFLPKARLEDISTTSSVCGFEHFTRIGDVEYDA